MFFALESAIKHIQGHLVALCSTRDRNQSLVAVVLRLIDLDNTATELSDLVDLRATLSNDSTNHIIWNEDLLSQRLAWNQALHWLSGWSSVGLRSDGASLMWLLRSDPTIASNCR